MSVGTGQPWDGLRGEDENKEVNQKTKMVGFNEGQGHRSTRTETSVSFRERDDRAAVGWATGRG